ncbi:hypothetical protein BLA29_004780 [Euroglyphus maynei]|uniref:RING-type domain-containing protein n=1 Tax=Euroglyphus maynei TaxID=6958 RepID=A0A1Y3AP58_EURMA|nr:hypothetical protein BLA29_004780 [Euroglyphus maynei]
MNRKWKSTYHNGNRIAICECLGKLPVYVPLESDGTLLVSKLSSIFPGAVNVQYMIGMNGWRIPKIIDGRIQEPPFDLGGWKCCDYFYCITIKNTSKMSDFDTVKFYEFLSARNLCRTYFYDGFCMQQIQQNCHGVHGDFCKECQFYALHPFNSDLRQQHEIECMAKKLKKIDIENCPENIDPDGIYGKLISSSICPRYEQYGHCNQQENRNCQLIHGDLCDICGRYSLHPFCELEREKHVQQCIEDLEMNRTCSICLEIIGQTPPPVSNSGYGDKIKFKQIDKCFGRLKNCCHIFCWDCIDQWRTTSKSSDCPICRIPSESVLKAYV